MSDEYSTYDPRYDEVFWTDSKLQEHINIDVLVSKLLIDEVLQIIMWGEKVTLCFPYTGVFDPYGDADVVSEGDLPSLYKAYIKDKEYGTTKWICCRYNYQPCAKVVKKMKEGGAWDDTMESLRKRKVS